MGHAEVRSPLALAASETRGSAPPTPDQRARTDRAVARSPANTVAIDASAGPRPRNSGRPGPGCATPCRVEPPAPGRVRTSGTVTRDPVSAVVTASNSGDPGPGDCPPARSTGEFALEPARTPKVPNTCHRPARTRRRRPVLTSPTATARVSGKRIARSSPRMAAIPPERTWPGTRTVRVSSRTGEPRRRCPMTRSQLLLHHGPDRSPSGYRERLKLLLNCAHPILQRLSTQSRPHGCCDAEPGP